MNLNKRLEEFFNAFCEKVCRILFVGFGISVNGAKASAEEHPSIDANARRVHLYQGKDF